MDSILPFIKYYQIFLNQVSYRKYIPANVNKVIIKGLAGNRNYDIMVMIYPKDKSLLPQQSNKVVFLKLQIIFIRLIYLFILSSARLIPQLSLQI